MYVIENLFYIFVADCRPPLSPLTNLLYDLHKQKERGGHGTDDTNLVYKLKDPGSIPPQRATIFFSHNDLTSQRPAPKKTHTTREIFIKGDDSYSESTQRRSSVYTVRDNPSLHWRPDKRITLIRANGRRIR